MNENLDCGRVLNKHVMYVLWEYDYNFMQKMSTIKNDNNNTNNNEL